MICSVSFKLAEMSAYSGGVEAQNVTPTLLVSRINIYGEFDPGSGRTLAACLTHASRTMKEEACFFWISGERVSNT